MGIPTLHAACSHSCDHCQHSRVSSKSDGLETIDLGVHRITFRKESLNINLLRRLRRWLGAMSLTMRLFLDLARLDLSLLFVVIFLSACVEIQPMLLLAIEVHLMRTIEIGLTTHSIDTVAVVKAIAVRTVAVAVFSVTERLRQQNSLRLKEVAKLYYEEVLLKAKLVDIPTLDEISDYDSITSNIPHDVFRQLVDFGSMLLKLISTIGFVANIVRYGNDGLVFILLCLAPTTLDFFFSKNMYMIPRIREAVNPHYLRMQSLLQLAEKQYRHDVLSGNIPQYIYEEFKKARKAMGHVSLDLPENIYQREQMSWTVSTLKSVVGDSTMIYFAFLAIFVSHRASMAILTGILKAASELRFSFNILFWQASALLSGLSSLKELYKLQDRQLQPGIDGYMGYPIAKTGAETSQGMGLELRHVSFCYPGARKKALEDVSLTIHPGQIVAIVGENGSGKSTLINLLTRMYDATEGEVLIDGANIKSLKISDLRNAAAILTQQHKLLPLTLGENIGIGRPERIGDEEMILEAARRSGAEGVLRKLGSDNTKSGLKATVGRYVEQALLQVDPKNEEDPLHRVWKTMQKQTSVSGGEQQRLVAARAFMKMNDPSVKLVAVDEPTSALDPEAEMHLFSNLRTAREGRTMLFVTHRFGHLTKHADAIICMKGGKIVERGDHNSLMKLRGVYCGLFHAATKALARSDTEISGSGDQTSERSN